MPVEVIKRGYTLTLSMEALHHYGACDNPDHERRGHEVERDWTDEERAQYAALAARWAHAKTEWEAVQADAAAHDWLTYGAIERDPELEPIPDKHRDWIFDETHDEWLQRITAEH